MTARTMFLAALTFAIVLGGCASFRTNNDRDIFTDDAWDDAAQSDS